MNFLINVNEITSEIKKRCTFAIISHPDAGKTTITEKLLYLGDVIRTVGVVKPKKNKKHTQSDWMDIEKKRGISVSTSVLSFSYKNKLINLLDTPGHSDFSEDTYRILSAVDFCLMVIDASKGVESCTQKLLQVAKKKGIPIITFINKIDKDFKNVFLLLDELEKELNMLLSPITYPIEYDNNIIGLYHFQNQKAYWYHNTKSLIYKKKQFLLNTFEKNNLIFTQEDNIKTQFFWKKKINHIQKSYINFQYKDFLLLDVNPVFFGSALDNFGIVFLLNFLVKFGPIPQPKMAYTRKIFPNELKFSGFVFKIQANMNLKHRDRIAFIRVVSGKYFKGIKLFHVRTKKKFSINNAISLLANNRTVLETAYPGDIIGIYNHGNIRIGDSFTESEDIQFSGINNIIPEIFKSVHLINPLHQKRLLKGIFQLEEEGAIQVFKKLNTNEVIIGALGILQFDVVSERLKVEYQIELIYKNVEIHTIRWIFSKNKIRYNDFINDNKDFIGIDNEKNAVYFVPNIIHLNIISEQNLDIFFLKKKKI
ncbi:peptide chain release factor 3 [Buchnera aphidicola (Thelaxes californica)]|uniref:Peptide chain release factor 3 n=1 Tax=Buchnera aphidicola (Thelaxes californica) TaxID=1315998 RepID=A0A4D6YD16_9GAMM|nr:peptide chain release factor 3 [Buchnera aphidicola]QCI26942.1 peptide chain release factor 3 [Buchnera aphidicola (Thelaxes californica)]